LRLTLVLAAGFALGACSSGGDAEVTDTSVSTPLGDATTTTTSEPLDDGSETTTSETTTSTTTTVPTDDVWSDTFAEISLTATEPGPRPLLAWGEVDGAALYQLTVLDAAGVPYWSWSGSTSAVHLGGMDNPDAMGAWVFEELTWMVVARAADGTPLAVSRRGTLEP
jgi:hypothetical protein